MVETKTKTPNEDPNSRFLKDPKKDRPVPSVPCPPSYPLDIEDVYT